MTESILELSRIKLSNFLQESKDTADNVSSKHERLDVVKLAEVKQKEHRSEHIMEVHSTTGSKGSGTA